MSFLYRVAHGRIRIEAFFQLQHAVQQDGNVANHPDGMNII
jgi:hypothetical protein